MEGEKESVTRTESEGGMAGIRTHEQRTIGTKSDALTHYTTEEEWEKIRVFELIYLTGGLVVVQRLLLPVV